MIYLQKLREEGGGEWEQIKVDPDQKSAEEWVREFYLASGWAESTLEAYEAQVAQEAPVEVDTASEDTTDVSV